jgi:hypothetical protein
MVFALYECSFLLPGERADWELLYLTYSYEIQTGVFFNPFQYDNKIQVG